MAIGIDCGVISLELANLLASTETIRRRIERFANPAMLGTLAASGVFNAASFSSSVPQIDLGSPWLNYAPAVALGTAIPAMIYVLVRIGSVLYLTVTPQRGG